METTTNGPSAAAVIISSPPKPHPIINTQMTILLACLLTASLLVCFFFFYFRRYPERQLALAATTRFGGGERRSLKVARPAGLDPAVIATFTTFTYSAVKGVRIGQEVLECAVCLNEFYDDGILRLLPECCHVFHRDCIDEWLALRVTCPVCRANLLPKPGQPGQLGHRTDSGFGQNEPTEEDHVTLDVINLKDTGSRKLSRSCSVGHPAAGRGIENVERYTLRLPSDHELKNVVVIKSPDYDIHVEESSLRKCLRSASANYIRESNYFAYERFGRD